MSECENAARLRRAGAETCALLGVGRKALKGLTYRGTRELRERLEATA